MLPLRSWAPGADLHVLPHLRLRTRRDSQTSAAGIPALPRRGGPTARELRPQWPSLCTRRGTERTTHRVPDRTGRPRRKGRVVHDGRIGRLGEIVGKPRHLCPWTGVAARAAEHVVPRDGRPRGDLQPPAVGRGQDAGAHDLARPRRCGRGRRLRPRQPHDGVDQNERTGRDLLRARAPGNLVAGVRARPLRTHRITGR